MADLKRKSVRGGMVTLVSQGITILVQLASTVILARLLSPEDYGVIAMVMAITTFAGLFRDLGLSSATIQKKNLTHAQSSNLFWINVFMGLALTVIVAAASPLVVWFYDKPELLWVTVALSANFLISSFSAQHGARLVREMQFGRQAIAGISGAISTLIISVILALQGWSYWALVWGTLTGSAVTTAILISISPFKPAWISKGSGVREMLGFGANVTAFDFVNYFHRNLDNILIGRFWGASSLGLYSRAYALILLPINAIRGPINAVAFPVLSQLQDQPEEYRRYYRKIISLLAILSIPLMGLIFIASHEIITLSLGVEWLEIVPIFSALALVGFIQPTLSMIGMVLLSCGKSGKYLRFGIYNAIAVSIAFLIGIKWGPFGVACGYAIAHYLTAYPFLLWAFKETPLTVSDYFQAIARPALSSIGAILGVLGVVEQFGGMSHTWVNLAVKLGVFGMIFIAINLIIPGGIKEIKRYGMKMYRSI